jgi:hypothetical protein
MTLTINEPSKRSTNRRNLSSGKQEFMVEKQKEK